MRVSWKWAGVTVLCLLAFAFSGTGGALATMMKFHVLGGIGYILCALFLFIMLASSRKIFIETGGDTE